jgi:hypothetical protein
MARVFAAESIASAVSHELGVFANDGNGDLTYDGLLSDGMNGVQFPSGS